MIFNTGDKVLFNNEFEGEVLAYDKEIKGCNYAVKIKAKNGYKLVKAKETQLDKIDNKECKYTIIINANNLNPKILANKIHEELKNNINRNGIL